MLLDQFQLSRPQTSAQDRSVGRQHNIVDKDYFRGMKTQKTVENSLNPGNKSKALSKSQNKFKTRSQLIMEEFKNPVLAQEKMYMIDKVVRMRGLQGRFGVDHSEILNYEFEVANKMRSDHMNRLVYKSTTDSQYIPTQGDYNFTSNDKENQGLSSMVLFQRLSQKEIQDQEKPLSTAAYENMSKSSNNNRSMSNIKDDGKKLSFNEWVKRKDAEKRMKQRLINDVKQEIRQEIYDIAQQEELDQEMKVKYMEDWLMQKRLNEAQKIAQLMDLQEKETIQRQMREQTNYKSYREWLKKNMLREKQQKYQLIKKRQELMEREKEEEMRRSLEAQIEYKQWQIEKNQQDKESRQQQQRREEEEEIQRQMHKERYSQQYQQEQQESNGSSQLYSPLRVRASKKQQ